MNMGGKTGEKERMDILGCGRGSNGEDWREDREMVSLSRNDREEAHVL